MKWVEIIDGKSRKLVVQLTEKEKRRADKCKATLHKGMLVEKLGLDYCHQCTGISRRHLTHLLHGYNLLTKRESVKLDSFIEKEAKNGHLI